VDEAFQGHQGSPVEARVKPASRKGTKRRADGPRVVKNGKQRSSGKTPPLNPATTASTTGNTPPIVGIGASAGGLETFTQLLKALPSDTGMAFVLIQHLDPRHESMLAKLLSTATRMPATEVKEPERVLPNHIYVISPNADIAVQQGVLHAVVRNEPAGRHMPVDYFFRSLAEDQGARAIGVVLSGTGSDGTLGLRAVKAEGGITFAQEPRSAKYDGMPQSAIRAECVDFVLPPAGIAKELSEISRLPNIGLSHPEETAPPLPAYGKESGRILQLLRAASGVEFTYYKKATIQRRIARRMALHRIERVSAYLKYLEVHPEELDALSRDFLVHTASFFEEPDFFRTLESKIFPQILAAKSANEPIRIWVPRCSTGEEAYSIAICLFEAFGDQAASRPVRIFATDVSEQALEKARFGAYPESALAQVSEERLRRFFVREGGLYRISIDIRKTCVFARHDLTKDPPYSHLDLISCRNALIYLDPALQKRVVSGFHYALEDTGFLVLGSSEALTPYEDLFTLLDRKKKFFCKKAVSTPGAYQWSPAVRGTFQSSPKQPEKEPPGFEMEKEIDRVVWERYGYAALVVNGDLQILHFRGDAGLYLRPSEGKPTFHLLKMLRDELVYELRSAIDKVRRIGSAVHSEQIRMKTNGQFREVSVEIRPFESSTKGEPYFLLLFESTSAAEEAQTESPPRKSRKTGNAAICRLENELARVRGSLQGIIRERETTNEELISASEDAVSSMEELQSANEELTTLNEQAESRNVELARISDDLTNVLAGVNIPILMLGGDRRIRRFTPAAEKLLHLAQSDVGRPIRDFRLGLAIPELDDLISVVLKEGRELQRDVRADDGRWYSIRLRPYWTSEQKIDGVLVALLDIHELKESQEAARREQRFVSAILDAASRALLVVVLDREGRIVHFNRACQETTGYSFEEAKGKLLWDLLVASEDMGKSKASFQQLLAGTPNEYEKHWVTKYGRRRLITWWNTVIFGDDRQTHYVIRAGIDITERRQSEATVRALLETAAQAILAIDSTGKIILANATSQMMFGYRRDELLDQPIASLIPKRFREQHAHRQGGFFSQPRNRPMGLGLNLHGMRKDGTEFPVEVSLSHIETPEGTLAVAFVSDITERKRSEEALQKSEAAARASQDQLRALTVRLLEAQEEERRRISRELHDDLNQRLAMLAVEVGEIRANLSPRSTRAVGTKLQTVEDRINALSDDARRTAYQLHPSVLEHLGLVTALESYCVDFSKQEAVKVTFKLRNVPKSIPPATALCLYRVTQECLRNVAKHAGTSRATVTLAGTKGGLTLTVSDAGRGFDPDSGKAEGGLGLVSIKERVMAVGGTVTIKTEPGVGTQILVRMPYEENPIEKTKAAAR
jgi:two-component system, chemotaxis family, CheB/CheR fusion protein